MTSMTPWSASSLTQSLDPEAIVVNFMPGQQAGNAVADVLFGDQNPSGKLPLTMPNKEPCLNAPAPNLTLLVRH